jgi:hypothetical protein
MSGVFLSGVSDYIDPSAACINPLFSPAPAAAPASAAFAFQPKISLAMEGVATAPAPPPPPPPKATLSVADCLSCSGCVTSTESILVEAQVAPAFLSLLQVSEPVYITLSPQTITDITAYAAKTTKQQIPADQVKALLVEALLELPRSPNTDLQILDSLPADVERAHLGSMVKDLQWRLSNPPALPHYTTTHYSVPVSKDQIELYPVSPTVDDVSTFCAPGALPPTPALPMLSSHCPGIICYVEKTLPDLLPHLTRTIPGMSLTSLVIKATNASAKVVSVQMCHDKKLEATRKDYAGGWGNATDLVLTTSEVWDLVKDSMVS